MALTDNLEDLVKSIIQGFNPAYDVDTDPDNIVSNNLQMWTKAMEHIQTNGVVNVASVSGVTSGSEDSGSGTGSIS